MKKNMIRLSRLAGVLAFVAIATAVIVSCQNENQTSSDLQNNAGENKSEIALIEEKLGVTLYKRDLTISDATGTSKLTIRVAGRDQSMVEEYLKARMFSIKPIFKREKRQTINLEMPQSDNSANADADLSYESTVVLEFVSQELQEGAIGLGFREQPNPDYNTNSNGRVKYYNYSEHVSNNWPSVLSFQAYAQVEFMIWYKGRWYQSWNPVFGPDTWCCYEFNDFDVDGPWRVSLRIQYDYAGDYYYEWFY